MDLMNDFPLLDGEEKKAPFWFRCWIRDRKFIPLPSQDCCGSSECTFMAEGPSIRCLPCWAHSSPSAAPEISFAATHGFRKIFGYCCMCVMLWALHRPWVVLHFRRWRWRHQIGSTWLSTNKPHSLTVVFISTAKSLGSVGWTVGKSYWFCCWCSPLWLALFFMSSYVLLSLQIV